MAETGFTVTGPLRAPSLDEDDGATPSKGTDDLRPDVKISLGPLDERIAAPSPRARAYEDLIQTLKLWRLWCLLGINDVKQRYRRSRLGQFWITINIAFFIGCIGFLNARLFGTDVQQYVPQFCVNYIIWIFILGVLNEAPQIYIHAENVMHQEPIPRLVLLFRLLIRNVIAFIHNVIIIPVVFIIFGWPNYPQIFISIIGLAFLIGFLLAASVIIAFACTRFRDLTQVLNNILVLVFFASPIMWRPSMLPPDLRWILDLNPIALQLHLVADPLLGSVPGWQSYLAATILLALMAGAAATVFVRFRSRLVYWL